MMVKLAWTINLQRHQWQQSWHHDSSPFSIIRNPESVQQNEIRKRTDSLRRMHNNMELNYISLNTCASDIYDIYLWNTQNSQLFIYSENCRGIYRRKFDKKMWKVSLHCVQISGTHTAPIKLCKVCVKCCPKYADKRVNPTPVLRMPECLDNELRVEKYSPKGVDKGDHLAFVFMLWFYKREQK